MHAAHLSAHCPSTQYRIVIDSSSTSLSNMPAVNSKIPAQYEKFNLLVIEFRDSHDRIVARYTELLMEGMRCGLAYTRNYLPRECIVHRANRDKVIINSARMHSIIDDVDRVGVCLDMLRDATNFEEGPDRLNEKAFMLKVEADPSLPRYRQGDGRAASCGSSHFMQALNAMEQGLVPYRLKMGHTPPWGRVGSVGLFCKSC